MKASPAAPARLAVSVIFFLNGAVLASWIPHIPEIRPRTAGDGRLGLVLLAMAAGAITAMPIAGAMVGRFGSRSDDDDRRESFALVTSAADAQSERAAARYGALHPRRWNGTLDVSMNAQAVAVEQRYGRPIMSSLSCALQPRRGSRARRSRASPSRRASDASPTCSPRVALPSPSLHRSSGGCCRQRPRRRSHAPTFAWPRAPFRARQPGVPRPPRRGAMADWSAVYLHDVLRETPPAWLRSASRPSRGDGGRTLQRRLPRLRYGPAAVLCASSTVAALGLSVALAIGDPGSPSSARRRRFRHRQRDPPFSSAPPVTFPASAPASRFAAVATTGYFSFSPAQH